MNNLAESSAGLRELALNCFHGLFEAVFAILFGYEAFGLCGLLLLFLFYLFSFGFFNNSFELLTCFSL